jgi:hypothetical protein
MIKDTEGEFDAIKELFNKVLNVDVTLKYDINDEIKDEFLDLIKDLKEAHSLEINLKKTIDISKITKVFWKIIESNLTIIYGEEITEIINSYIKSKKSKFKTEDDLWLHVKSLMESYEEEEED